MIALTWQLGYSQTDTISDPVRKDSLYCWTGNDVVLMANEKLKLQKQIQSLDGAYKLGLLKEDEYWKQIDLLHQEISRVTFRRRKEIVLSFFIGLAIGLMSKRK